MIAPHVFRGYGHEFEKVYTRSRIAGGSGHHRIISYRFYGLNFIVRHETDGYVDDVPAPSSSNGKEQEDDSLSHMLGSLSLSSKDKPRTTTAATTTTITMPAGSKITIIEEGRIVPLASTLEIKMHVVHKPLTIVEVVPQLWVSQTPKLVRAHHDRGMFRGIGVEDVGAEIQRWELENQRDLKRLGVLVGRIVEVVKGCEGYGVVRFEGGDGDELVIREVMGRRTLPRDLYEK